VPLLTLDRLSIAFGHLPLLDEANLQVEPRERVCVLGRNGSGKSTLLRILSGEQQPDAGTVWRQPNLRVARLDQDVPIQEAEQMYIALKQVGVETVLVRYPREGHGLREPDHVVTVQTRSDQALLYRLSGDRNPLHSDPSFAAMGGFDRPILHGLCTYGFTGRALLHELCGSDPARFSGMDARFSSPVLPGEALTVRAWVDGDGSAVFQTCGQDGRIVIDAGRLTYR